MAVQLYAHNMQAYQVALEMLARHGKAAVIHAMGTGKSFIALRWIEAALGKLFLWLSPSDDIVRTQFDNFKCNGNLRVPFKYVTLEDIQMDCWVSNQSKAWRKDAGRMSGKPDQCRMLERIVFFA